MLIVGTRGRSLGGLQGLLPGSVSKYCLQHSPVPVIVVRPTYKREKKKKKRQADPSRKNYLDILEKSGAKGASALDRSTQASLLDDTPTATDNEAEAVAAAIGLTAAPDSTQGMSTLTKVQTGQSARSDATSARSDATSYESPSPTDDVLFDDPRSPGLVMRSPSLGDADSPAASDSDSSGDESEGEGKVEAASGSAAGSSTRPEATIRPAQIENSKTGR